MRLSSAVLETPNIRNPLIVKSECPYMLQSGYIAWGNHVANLHYQLSWLNQLELSCDVPHRQAQHHSFFRNLPISS